MPRRPRMPTAKPQVHRYRPRSGVRYFTHYWKNETWDENSHQEGEPLRHAADNQFRLRGVAVGDFVYVVTVIAGRLFLLGRIEVDRILGQEEAEAAVGATLWQADDHILAKPGTENPLRFRREVPIKATKGLRFM